MPEPGVQKAVVSANTATQIKSGRTILRRIIISDPGTTWELSIIDQDGAEGGATLITLKPNGARNIECGFVLDQGLRVSGSGTAGQALFLFE